MANVIYNAFKKNIMNGGIDLDTNTVKVALVTSSHTPDQDADEDMADIDNQVEGTGYTAGGAELANKAVTADNTDNEGVFDADDVSWADSTITARGAIVYKSTGTPANDLLICYIDFGEDKVSSGGTFTIAWAAEGILNLN